MGKTRSWNKAWLAAVIVLGVALAICLPRTIRWQRRAAALAERAEKKRQREARDGFQRAAQSVVIRSGLPNLRRKAEAREPVVIGFIGGSITFNAGHGGFVSEIPAWLTARFPGLKVQTINAAISATGSEFGAQRVDRDVLVHHPDLVVIEFAVNDSGLQCQTDMERLVRKVRMAESAPEILMIYTLSHDALPKLERGKFPGSVNQHETVAAHYDLPTVALGYEAARKIQGGEWMWSDFSADECHPSPKGYESYNADIDAALNALVATGTPGPKPLPPVLTPNLVVYPPPAKAEPQPPPSPLLDERGAPATRTDELPLFGNQWIGAAEYPPGSEPIWHLYFEGSDPSQALTPAIGLDRHGWKPQRWFDEARTFTGDTSHPLARSQGGKGNFFGSSLTDEPIATWRAPGAGRCLLSVAAEKGFEGSGVSPDTRLGVNIVRYQAEAAMGESVAFQSGGPEEMLDLRKTAKVSPGDTIAFVFHATRCKFAAYRGFRITIGYFADDGANVHQAKRAFVAQSLWEP
jgi:lysophospholipase L1-like esterase